MSEPNIEESNLPSKRSINISEEERERRRELARKMHNEVIDPDSGRRRFGGKQPGSGRPRVKRAAELVAEEARANAVKIVRAYKDALDERQPIGVRVNAAREWLLVENKEAALQLAEDREIAKMDQTELIARISTAMLRVMKNGALDSEITSRIEVLEDGEVIEVEPEED